jgi:hypothetical protein
LAASAVSADLAGPAVSVELVEPAVLSGSTTQRTGAVHLTVIVQRQIASAARATVLRSRAGSEEHSKA